MSDHYMYPGSEALINIPGFSDEREWKAAESFLIDLHMQQLIRSPIPGDFDLSHLRRIHAALVEGFYTWGGQLRDVNTGPGGTGIAHCRPEYIEAECDRIFTAVAEADFYRGRDRAGFAAGLAWAWGEITAVHPFRDGNTRSQFMFFNQLTREAGWRIDWDRIDPYVFAFARNRAITTSEDGLIALLQPALISIGEDSDAELRLAAVQAAASFTQPRPDRTPEELEADLAEVMERFNTDSAD